MGGINMKTFLDKDSKLLESMYPIQKNKYNNWLFNRLLEANSGSAVLVDCDDGINYHTAYTKYLIDSLDKKEEITVNDRDLAKKFRLNGEVYYLVVNPKTISILNEHAFNLYNSHTVNRLDNEEGTL